MATSDQNRCHGICHVCSQYTVCLLYTSTGEKIFAGGKGINVSMVLKNLGMSNTSLGFTAGFTGNEIKRLLAKKGDVYKRQASHDAV